MAMICGIDEAGRGPVIGPLMICGAMIAEEEEYRLKNLKVRDSKQLTPAQREKMAEVLREICKFELCAVTPEQIDGAVESKATNLNWLEAECTARVINSLKPDTAYIDCPSPNIPAYSQYLQKLITVKCKLVLAHKADVKYPIVSAASILAKVARDREIRELQKRFVDPIGSGYPADPITVAFLQKHAKSHPEIFRKSWSSYRRITGGKNQKTLEGF